MVGQYTAYTPACRCRPIVHTTIEVSGSSARDVYLTNAEYMDHLYLYPSINSRALVLAFQHRLGSLGGEVKMMISDGHASHEDVD